jgi:hypothetical protein
MQQELEQREFDQGQERRKVLAAELAALPAKRDKATAPLGKAVEVAADALRQAERALTEAQRAYNDAIFRAVIVPSDFDGRANALINELEMTSPECLRTTWERVDLMRSNMRHCCRATHERLEPRWNGSFRRLETWNTDEVRAVERELDDMLDELRGLMRRVDMTLPLLERRAAELLRRAQTLAEPMLKDAWNDSYRRSRDALFPVAESA